MRKRSLIPPFLVLGIIYKIFVNRGKPPPRFSYVVMAGRAPPSSRIFRYPLYGPSVAGPQRPGFEYSERSIICNLRDTVSQIVPLIFLNKSFFSGKSLFTPICETLSHKSVDSSRQPNFLFQQLVYSTLGYRTSRVMDVFLLVLQGFQFFSHFLPFQ